MLKEITGELLGRIAEPLRDAIEDWRLAPMILTREELAQSTDVFPRKFRGMQRSHRLLAGEDVLAELTIASEHLRLRCEQELKNLNIRLRVLRVRFEEDPESFQQVLCRSVEQFARIVPTLLELKGQDVPAGRARVLTEAAAVCGFDAGPISELLALRTGETTEESARLAGLHEALMRAVSRAAEVADGLQVS